MCIAFLGYNLKKEVFPCGHDLWRNSLCSKDTKQFACHSWMTTSLEPCFISVPVVRSSLFFWLQGSGQSPHASIVHPTSLGPRCGNSAAWAGSRSRCHCVHHRADQASVAIVDLPLLCSAKAGYGCAPGKTGLEESVFVVVLVMGRKTLASALAFGSDIHQLLCQRAWLVCCK